MGTEVIRRLREDFWPHWVLKAEDWAQSFEGQAGLQRRVIHSSPLDPESQAIFSWPSSN